MTQSIYHSAVNPFPSVPRTVMRRSDIERVIEPNYAARRAFAAAAVAIAVMLVIASVVLLAGLGGRPASASRAEPALTHSTTVYVASPGDSLWSIARSHRGGVSLDRYVDALIDLNGGTEIQVGQAIRLP